MYKKTLLISYVGTIGNIANFDGTFKTHLSSNVNEIESDTFEEYLLYYLRSDFGYSELSKQKKATAQKSISIKAIREAIVILPEMTEQFEIVRLLDNYINKLNQVKKDTESILEQIDIIKKAILSRALGVN